VLNCSKYRKTWIAILGSASAVYFVQVTEMFQRDRDIWYACGQSFGDFMRTGYHRLFDITFETISVGPFYHHLSNCLWTVFSVDALYQAYKAIVPGTVVGSILWDSIFSVTSSMIWSAFQKLHEMAVFDFSVDEKKPESPGSGVDDASPDGKAPWTLLLTSILGGLGAELALASAAELCGQCEECKERVEDAGN
jgi:hypothetical protein